MKRHNFRTHNCGELRAVHTEEKVTLCGWVARVRDLGGLLFLSIRDQYGKTQVVTDSTSSLANQIQQLSVETVVRVTGIVNNRPADMLNKSMLTGDIEVNAQNIEIINQSELIPLGVEDQDVEEAHLSQAVHKARIEELVKQLPMGLDTFIGEEGIRLSGGQRQRVALARAFYHNRSVLIMDEATSALDQETENEITEEIKYLTGKITLIVIAHRHTTVRHCDRIIRLEQGRIVEEGSPQQVLQPPMIANERKELC